MSATKAIIISTPKFITAEPALEIALAPRSPMLASNSCRTKTVKRASFQCVSTMEKIPCPPLPATVLVEHVPTSRKRRLDHLTLEEKIQRKKLKNRIAAQSSRDRKKAKMDEMELEVKELKDQVASLASQCQRLQGEVARLAEENACLRVRQSTQPLPAPASPAAPSATAVGCAPAVPGPAASSPLPQGRGARPAAVAAGTRARAVLVLAMVALLARATHCRPSATSWTPSTTTPWRWRSWSGSRTASSRRPSRSGRSLQSSETRCLAKWWGRHQRTWTPVARPPRTLAL